MKTIIGIIPTIKLNQNDNPYEDIYKFVDSYSARLIEEGALPIGILLNNGELDKNILDICNGFLFPGGNRIDKIHYEIIEYAIKNNKPILGICLGMQALASYSILKEKSIEKHIEPTAENLISIRKQLQDENIYILKKLEPGHIHGEKIMNEKIEITRKNLLESNHQVTIKPNTKLYDCYKKEHLNVISLHSYILNEPGKDFEVSATAEDGTIEAIEHIDSNLWIVGLQFHTELEQDNPIWKTFINEVKKRTQKEA